MTCAPTSRCEYSWNILKRIRASYTLVLYVDDLLMACNDMSEITRIKERIGQEFDKKDLGPAERILGMQIQGDRQRKLFYLSQEECINY